MTRVLQFGQHQLHIFSDLAALSIGTAEYVNSLVQTTSPFYISLSGGSTPQRLYECLVEMTVSSTLLNQWHVFWGDERYVAHDHVQSNYKMACDAWLNKVPIPAQQIHPIPTHCDDIADCVAQYQQLLTHLPTQDGYPCFDLVLLGIGDDGHTASLFPDTSILQNYQDSVASVYVDKLAAWRVSLTYPILNHAKKVLVLVSGEGKAEILQHVISGTQKGYPIQSIDNPNGMLWFVDEAAARLIESCGS